MVTAACRMQADQWRATHHGPQRPERTRVLWGTAFVAVLAASNRVAGRDDSANINDGPGLRHRLARMTRWHAMVATNRLAADTDLSNVSHVVMQGAPNPRTRQGRQAPVKAAAWRP